MDSSHHSSEEMLTSSLFRSHLIRATEVGQSPTGASSSASDSAMAASCVMATTCSGLDSRTNARNVLTNAAWLAWPSFRVERRLSPPRDVSRLLAEPAPQ